MIKVNKLNEIRLKNINSEIVEPNGLECDLCGNKGYTAYLSDNDEIIFKECECDLKRRVINEKNKEPSAPKFGEHTLENFTANTIELKEMKDTIKDYIENGSEKGGWVYLGGAVGVGKTHLANAVYDELLLKGYKGKYINYFTLQKLSRDMKSFNVETQTKATILYDNIINNKMLLIDDIFKNQERFDGGEALAWEIINARYLDENLITIITSEITPQELYSRDKSLFSRIYERCEGNKYMLSIGEKVKNYRLEK